MANILIFPLPEFGHILPTLQVTRYLAAQGHRVIYLTAPQFTSIISEVGGEITPLIKQDIVGEMLSGATVWYRFSGSCEDHWRRVRKLRDLIAALLRTLHIQIALCDYFLGLSFRMEVIGLFGSERTILFASSLFNWGTRRLDETDCPLLVFCPEVFELPCFRQTDASVFHVEASLSPIDISQEPLSDAITSDRIVFASFGTQSVRYRDMSARMNLLKELAVRHPSFQFIVSLGRSLQVSYLRDINFPSNVTVRATVPQRYLLKKASALITHGGLGSLKEAIYEEVPPIVLPASHDQPYNAMRIRGGGLGGAVFPEKLSVDCVDALLIKAIAGEYAGSLTQMSKVFHDFERRLPSHRFIQKRLAT